MAQTPPITSVGPLNLDNGRGNVWARLNRSVSSRFSNWSFFSNYRNSGGYITQERPPIGEGGINRSGPTLPRRKEPAEDGSATRPQFQGNNERLFPAMQAGRAARRYPGTTVQPEMAEERSPKGAMVSERLSSIFRRANRLSTMIGEAFRAGKLGAPPRDENATQENGDGSNSRFNKPNQRYYEVDFQRPQLDIENPTQMYTRPQQQGQQQQSPLPPQLSDGSTESVTCQEKILQLTANPLARKATLLLFLLIVVIILIVSIQSPSGNVLVRGVTKDEAASPSIRFNDGVVAGGTSFYLENPEEKAITLSSFDGVVKYNGEEFGLVSLTTQPTYVSGLKSKVVDMSITTTFSGIEVGRTFSKAILDDCGDDGFVTFVLEGEINVMQQSTLNVRLQSFTRCDASAVSPPTN